MQKNNQHNVKMEFGNMHKNGVLNLYIIHKRSPAIFSGLLFLDFLIRLKK